jgi:hypothetical protein
MRRQLFEIIDGADLVQENHVNRSIKFFRFIDFFHYFLLISALLDFLSECLKIHS